MSTALTVTPVATDSSQAAQLEAGPFRNPEGTLFVRIPVNGHFENWPINSERCERFIEYSLFRLSGAMPKKSEVNEIKRQLEGVALFEGEEHPTPLRVASYLGNLYFDLCNERWQVVEVSEHGWQVLDESPVRFRRSPGMQALPEPVAGGSVQELLNFVNVGNHEQQILLLSWLIATFRPTGPYPILAIKGQQGSAKSTCQRILRSLIDPSDSPLRTTPKEERDLMVSAKNAHLIAFDNLSSIPARLSDSFCRLATGGGLAKRRNYTDDKEIIFQGSRPIVINGIEDLAERGDLLDRIVSLHLPPIPKHIRRSEADLSKEFEEARPRILGALLDVLVNVLQRIECVHLATPPRMADFAIWSTAAEEALGFEAGEFVHAYEANRKESSLLALESSSAASEMVNLVKNCGIWEGTCGELLAQLNLVVGDSKRDPQWPKSARALSATISRAEPNLGVAGIRFTRLQRQGVARRIRLESIVTPSQASPAAVPVTQENTEYTAVQ